MEQQVYWQVRRPAVAQPALGAHLRADVAVVGGGILGLSCAQRLRASGASVVLVEREVCGAGASGRSSGFVTPASEIDLHTLESMQGPERARQLWEFVSAGVEAIRAHARDVDCDYEEQDSLFVANRGRGEQIARKEHAARGRFGYGSRLYAGEEVQQVIATTRFAEAVRYGPTFAIDPFAYCRALKELVQRAGALVFEGSRVLGVEPGRVVTSRGSVSAEHVVVCTDRFLPELGALQDEVFHVQTFLAIAQAERSVDVRALFPDGPMMVWDSALLYHYFRPAPEGRLLLGGADLLHTYARRAPASLEPEVAGLVRHFHALFPWLTLRVEYAWSGMLGVSKDLLPVMGADPRSPQLWYAGAATGLPWGAALGRYAAERILHGRSELDAVLSPRRKFLVGPRLQSLLSKPVTFAVCNGVAKLA